ncbi:TRAP transporter, DctM subunit/TRAP transporter, 4TM/12TM fusion protein [Gracilibacillus ureilyticus]|uniref:TRAP transporter, DctM subunit/TRAP transporter, 4TM/12TM fusion protein n=1 Tax=Gracilibacillus ureilyticus TaxID=531814 RepID=A0A1H9MSS1_9BACI|nr:TRAP transporter fused permease subunit [Gracilibacillus ureilyticus]SER26537.1 TRAP transporter, DctM subunit/TRAP transporter, 4TM/12TM fusion protein [Gracilibacillus ureilyticus]
MRNKLIALIAVSWALTQIFSLYFVSLEAMQTVILHLGYAVALTFLCTPLQRFRGKDQGKLAIDMVMAGCIFAASIYFIMEYDRIRNHMLFVSSVSPIDIIAGGVTILFTLEATRRVLGWPLTVLAIISLGYLLAGPYLPGIFTSREITVNEFIEYNYFTTNGLLGVALQTSATYVYVFVLFASLLNISGLGPKFMDIIISFAGKWRGGPAKVSVLSSGLFGMITGSPSSNVAFTGSFTIPLMKKTGFSASYAGAVEAVASSAGMITPPLMGTAVFLIAQYTQTEISSIVIAAIIPALLYFALLFIQVDLESAKMNMKPIEKQKLPSFGISLKSGWHLMIPVIVIIIMLLNGYSPQLSALFSIIIAIILSYLKKESRLTINKLIAACIETGKTMTIIAAATATAGIILSCITYTGMEFKLTGFLVSAAGDSLLLLVLFIAILSFILGMGMPVLPAYMIVSIITAPVLVDFGVDMITAHLFVFYFAMMSLYTPPVGPASFVAAGIAETGPFRTGWDAMKLGIGGCIIPFLFVYHPVLLSFAPLDDFLLSIVPVLTGIYGVAVIVSGHMVRKLFIWERILFIAVTFLLFSPNNWIQWSGVILFVIIYFIAKRLYIPNEQKIRLREDS